MCEYVGVGPLQLILQIHQERIDVVILGRYSIRLHVFRILAISICQWIFFCLFALKIRPEEEEKWLHFTLVRKTWIQNSRIISLIISLDSLPSLGPAPELEGGCTWSEVAKALCFSDLCSAAHVALYRRWKQGHEQGATSLEGKVAWKLPQVATTLKWMFEKQPEKSPLSAKRCE